MTKYVVYMRLAIISLNDVPCWARIYAYKYSLLLAVPPMLHHMTNMIALKK
jgi:hypothetical protein